MLEQIRLYLTKLEKDKKLIEFSAVKHITDTEVEYRGKRVIDFTNWDFLGLRSDKKLKEKLLKDIYLLPFAPATPRTLAGNYFEHILCEEHLSRFFSCEDTLLFSSKNQAVVTLITSLFNEKDILFVEENSFNPVIDAGYLINAEVKFFQSDNLLSLKTELEKIKFANRIGIFVDALSPFTGKCAPLQEIFQCLTPYPHAVLFVDESFALASTGIRGAGVTELISFKKDIFCIYGSLGYGFAACGAFLSGSALVKKYILNTSRNISLEPGLPIPIIQYLVHAIGRIEAAYHKRTLLQERLHLLTNHLLQLGFTVHTNTSGFVCIHFKQSETAKLLHLELLKKGLLTEPLSVSRKASALRIILNAEHSEKHILTLVKCIDEVRKNLTKER
jgi:8-amino-7-oxononanoate synthase